ncbi:MAG: RNA-binding domain-containing protein [Patescibacteria group bacterium]
MRRIIVKEGPLVFLRDVLVMEIIAIIFFFTLSFLGNYEMIFKGWGLNQFIRYDLFLAGGFSLFQLGYIILLFLNWYFSRYEITEKEIIRRSGIIFSRRKSVNMQDVASVEIYQSPLGRMIHHATIILEHQAGRVTKIKNISNFEEYVHIIKQMARASSGRMPTGTIEDLIQEGENATVEFKETFRYDVRKNEVSKDVEHAVAKAIVGFMNADGGTLLIGVDDGGEVKGLESDYKALPKKNRDGLENHFNMLVKTMIGLPFAKYVSVKFEKVTGKDVCMVMVRESHKPAYVRNGDKKEEFFVRVGNSTQPFSMSEAEEYIKTHWK